MEKRIVKTALITGCSSGIGLALTKKMLEQNYQVLATTKSGKLAIDHPRLTVVELDLSVNESIEAAGHRIAQLNLQIDLLINNAGVAPDIHLTKPSYTSFTATLAVNLTGTVFFTECILPLLSSSAQIINVSSAMGLFANAAPNAYAYRISKAGLNFYTKLLALLYKDTDIEVKAIHPGWVRTKLGGADADVDEEWSANEIFNTLLAHNSGQFIDVYAKESFLM